MVARTVHRWVAVLVGAIGGLAGVIMLVDPTSYALWAWVLVAVVVLALREAYVRYLQEDLHSLDPVPFPLEDDDHWHAR